MRFSWNLFFSKKKGCGVMSPNCPGGSFQCAWNKLIARDFCNGGCNCLNDEKGKEHDTSHGTHINCG